MVTSPAHPPETLEGWYALHQIYTCDVHGVEQGDTLESRVREVASHLEPPAEGWSLAVRLIGSASERMVIHFRPALDGIGRAQDAFAPGAAKMALHLDYSFLSVTEAGLY